ncbi:MAG: restriction endonuclease subunit S [Prevotella sp.]|nr:restriction endonuclease subunit S [Prevotella sp.]
MSEWKKVKLGDYIDVLSGFAYKSKDFSDSGIPVIKIKNVCPPYISLEDLSYVPNSIAFQNPKYILKKGDVLIAMTGSHINQIASVVGRVGRVRYDDVTVLNQRVGKIVNKNEEKSSLDYIYYYLSQYEVKVELAQKAGGAANQANISPSDIKNLLFPCPPIEVQHRIATILSRYDSMIENYQKQIKLLEEAAQRLYKEWFVDLHFPGHENTKIVNGVPEGWEKKPISQLGEYLNGFAFKPSDWQESGKPIIKIKEMGNGVSNDTPRNNGERVPAKYLVKAGDLLFSWSATLMVIVWSGEEGWLNQHLFKVTPAKGIGREFLLQSISNTIEEFQNLTTGSTMKHIQRNKLDQVFVNVPNDEIMKRYSSIAEKERAEILHLSSQIRLLTEARDRLLLKLMSGEIAV